MTTPYSEFIPYVYYRTVARVRNFQRKVRAGPQKVVFLDQAHLLGH